MRLTEVLDEKTMGAGAFCALTMQNADTIRDWRRQGLLDWCGSQGENGRWAYSVADCVNIWIGVRLAGPSQMNYPLKQAFHMASLKRDNVMAIVADNFWGDFEDVVNETEPPYSKIDRSKFFVFAQDWRKSPSQIDFMRTYDVANLGNIPNSDWDSITVLNIGRFAEIMPDMLKSQVIMRVEVYREMLSEALTKNSFFRATFQEKGGDA